MEESFAVGVTLELSGNVASALDTLIANLERFDEAAKASAENVTALGAAVRSLGRAGRSIDTLIRAMDKLRDTSGMDGAVSGVDKMAAASERMLRVTEDLAGVMKENARLAAETAASLQAGAKATEAAASASAKSGKSGGAHHDYMIAGLGAQMVGDPMVSGAQSAFERAIEVEHLRQQLLSDQRVTPARADQAVASAYSATNAAPGTRVSENMSALIDLKNVTGSLDEATKMLPEFARMSALLAVMDRKRGGAGDPAFAAAKAMEIMGAMTSERTDPSGHTVREIDPALLQQRLAMLERVAVATNMRVDPQQYLGFAKQARVAGMTLSDEFIYEKLPALLQVLGGQRTGTAMMSIAQVFEGGRMQAKSYDALAEIGLADPSAHKTERYRDAKGRIRSRELVNSEGIYDLDILKKDPLEWIQAASKRMEAHGIHGTENQIMALMKASQRSTIAGLLADLLKDEPAVLKEQQNIRNTNPNIATQMAANDPAAKLQQFEAAWDKLLTSFGSAGLDDAIKTLGFFTDKMNALGNWAKENPDIAGPITKTIGALGVVFVGLGTISMAMFFTGPALGVFGGAISWLGRSIWSAVPGTAALATATTAESTAAASAAAATGELAAAEATLATEGVAAAGAVIGLGTAITGILGAIGGGLGAGYITDDIHKKTGNYFDPITGTTVPGDFGAGGKLSDDPVAKWWNSLGVGGPGSAIYQMLHGSSVPPQRDNSHPLGFSGPPDGGPATLNFVATEISPSRAAVSNILIPETPWNYHDYQDPNAERDRKLNEVFPPRPMFDSSKIGAITPEMSAALMAMRGGKDLIGTITPSMQAARAEMHGGGKDLVGTITPEMRQAREEAAHKQNAEVLQTAILKAIMDGNVKMIEALHGLNIPVTVNMDGKVVAKQTASNISREMAKPPTSSTSFNTARDPLPTGAMGVR